MSLKELKCPLCGKAIISQEQADYWHLRCGDCKINAAIAYWGAAE